MGDKDKRGAGGKNKKAKEPAPRSRLRAAAALRSIDPGLRLTSLHDLPDREIVFLGFVFHSETPGDPGRYSRRGHFVLDQKYERTRRELLGVILESARFMTVDVPYLFTPDVAELFYREGRLEEVRLGGHNVCGINGSGRPVYLGTMTDPAPAFGVAPDGRVVPAAADHGRSYLAAYRKDDSLVVSWDIKDQGDGERRPEAVYCLFEVGPGDSQGAGAPRELDVRPLARTEEELRGKSVDGLREWLLLPEPVEASDPRVIEVGDRYRKLTYVYEREEARRQLAEYYARNADLSEHLIGKLAREESVPPERARAVVMLEHRRLRDEFVENNMDAFFDRSADILKDVFEGLLTGEVNSLVLADGLVPGMDVGQSRADVREGQRKDEDRMTADRLGLPRRGRARGASPKRSAEKGEAKRADNKRRLEEAVGKLLRDAAGGDWKKIGAAIGALTAEKVGELLGRDTSTVYRWAGQGWGDFNTAKIEIGMKLRDKK